MEDNQNFIHNKFGYCYYQICETDGALIYNLYVEPEYRQKGHARHLVELVIREIKATGYTDEIMIQAQPRENSVDVVSLVSFYKRMELTVI